MTDLERVRRSAYRVSKRFGLSHEMSEDFAQTIVMKRLEGKGLTQKVNHAVVDEMRSEFGRVEKNSKESARQQFRHNLVNIDTHHVLPSITQIQTMKDLMDYLDDMESVNRCMVVLLVIWGFTRKEIAFCFGIGEHIVTQILKKEIT